MLTESTLMSISGIAVWFSSPQVASPTTAPRALAVPAAGVPSNGSMVGKAQDAEEANTEALIAATEKEASIDANTHCKLVQSVVESLRTCCPLDAVIATKSRRFTSVNPDNGVLATSTVVVPDVKSGS